MVIGSAFFQAYVQSDFFGKMIFLALFILSVVSWVLLLVKVKLSRGIKKGCNDYEKIFAQKRVLQVSLKGSKGFHPYRKIFESLKEKTLEVLNKNQFFSKKEEGVYLSQGDIDLLHAYVDTTISDISKGLGKNLFVLSTIVTLAPFMGLLGTVWGILITFSHLQTHSISSGNIQVLSGLSMALSTTVIGLIVAIPALVAYNYLKNALKELTKDMHHFASRLLITIEMQYKKVDVD